MSTKKSIDVNKARLTALKRIGVLKDVSAKGTLSSSDKTKIRNEFKKFHAVANAAPGEYKAQNISKLSDSDKKKLRESGYLISKDKLFLPKQGYDNASIKQVWTRNPKTGYQEKTLQITRKKGDRKIETEFIGKPLEKMEWRDRLINEYQQGKFAEGEFIGVKVFDNGKFEREIVLSLDVLFRYLEGVKWHDRDHGKLYDNLHLVKIHVKDFRDITANEKTRKEVDHTRYIKKKNSKSTKTLRVTNPEKLREINARKASRKKPQGKITGRKKK